MNVLVTGGAGYIGSHTALALAEAGHSPVLLDNLSNAKSVSAERAARLAGREIPLVIADVLESGRIESVLREQAIEAVIHFAARKSVDESVARPHFYYEQNIGGTLALTQAMERCGVRKLVFSSSATVYAPRATPCAEEDPVMPSNPYGATKLAGEVLLKSLAETGHGWSVMALRYFNPVGAHESGRMGENPLGTPANLVPYLLQVLTGRRDRLRIFGNDYPTPDGTGQRDYVHVMDIAEGHVAALHRLAQPGYEVLNLGTGRATSVLELVNLFNEVTGREIPTELVARRPGDIPFSCAEVSKAARLLDWRAQRSLRTMCEDAWRWTSLNPNGYE